MQEYIHTHTVHSKSIQTPLLFYILLGGTLMLKSFKFIFSSHQFSLIDP